MQKALQFTRAVGASVELLCSDNPPRKYCLIVNHSVNQLYLGLGNSAVDANNGILVVASGGWYEINSTNLWTGEIYAIGSGAGTTTSVTEW